MDFKSINRRDTHLEATLESIHITQCIAIADLKTRYPNVKHLSMQLGALQLFLINRTLTEYLNELFTTYRLETVILNDLKIKKLPNSIWQPYLRHLELHASYSGYRTELQLDVPDTFENHLETLSLSYISTTSTVLFDTLTLKTFNFIFYNQLPPAAFAKAHHLESLKLEKCNFMQTHFDLSPFPRLRELSLNGHDLPTCPDLAKCPDLKSFHLTMSGTFADFQTNWDALQNLEHLYIYVSWQMPHYRAAHGHGLSFKALSNLKTIVLYNLSFEAEQDFLGSMPQLTSLRLHRLTVHHLSDALFKSPYLKECNLSIHPTRLPDTFFDNPAITELDLSGSENMILKNKIMFSGQYKKFNFNFPRYTFKLLDAAPFHSNFMKLIEGLSVEQKTIIGYLLLEGLESVPDWQSFRTHFFELLQHPNLVWRGLVAENLHLLNTHQTLFEIPKNSDLYVGKTIAFVGYTGPILASHKEKLTSLKIDFQLNVQKNTDWIVLGQGKKIDLPIDFWSHPHEFMREDTLELFLAEAAPAFLQAPEMAVSAQLQALLWSGDAANDTLVVEMLNSGGVPLEILSDVVTVASLCGDTELRRALRRLVRPLLPIAAHKLFMRRFNMSRVDEFRHFATGVPHIDLGQIAYCYIKRQKEQLSHSDYSILLTMPETRNNPNRKDMLAGFLQQNKKDQHQYLNQYHFTELELIELLVQMPHIQHLHISVGTEGFLQICRLEALTSLHIIFLDTVLPPEIGHLKQLETLSIHSEPLQGFPKSLLTLPKLENLSFSMVGDSESYPLPLEYEIFQTCLKNFSVTPQAVYTNAVQLL